MSDVGGERIPVPQGKTVYPPAVRVAGIIWLAYGSLCLLGGLAILVWSVVVWNRGPASAVGFIPLVCGVGVLGAGLFGAAFLSVGVGAVRGTVRDTLGPGLASCLFGLLALGLGIYGFLMWIGLVAARPWQPDDLASALIALLYGIGLVAAGGLAVLGRSKYVIWRQVQEK